MYMEGTFMVHVSLNQSKYEADNLALWGSAVKHAVGFTIAFLIVSLV